MLRLVQFFCGNMLFRNTVAWTSMLRRDLMVVGNQLDRCNDSSPRYTRENHYANLCPILEFPTFSNHKIKHNASENQNVRIGTTNPIANIVK